MPNIAFGDEITHRDVLVIVYGLGCTVNHAFQYLADRVAEAEAVKADAERNLVHVHLEMVEIESTMLRRMVAVQIAVGEEGDAAMRLTEASMTINCGQQLLAQWKEMKVGLEKEAEEKLKEIGEAEQDAKQIVEKAQEAYEAMAYQAEMVRLREGITVDQSNAIWENITGIIEA